MAISIFDVQENKVSSDLSSYAIYLYGLPKSGKTTFASQMPQPLILAAEIGYKAIPGVKAIDVSTWADIKKVIRELKDPRAKDLFKTIVFDTLDLTGGMCEKYICQQNGVEALKEITSQIVEAVHSVLEKTPPELAADVSDRGIVLTGGGSLLYGLEELIEEKTGITTMTAEEPMTAVAIGTGKFVEFLSGKRDDD